LKFFKNVLLDANPLKIVCQILLLLTITGPLGFPTAIKHSASA